MSRMKSSRVVQVIEDVIENDDGGMIVEFWTLDGQFLFGREVAPSATAADPA